MSVPARNHTCLLELEFLYSESMHQVLIGSIFLAMVLVPAIVNPLKR